MLIPKANTKKIYETLFSEGVLVAKKDFSAPKHTEIDVPNLHVIKTMQSLVSKKLVREQFAWRHYYWYLENEGVEVRIGHILVAYWAVGHAADGEEAEMERGGLPDEKIDPSQTCSEPIRMTRFYAPH